MNNAERTLTTTRRLVTASVGLAGLCAASVQALAGSWLASVAAVLAAALWVALRRRRVGRPAPRLVAGILSRADILVQVSFLALGVLMFVGLAFRLLPVAVGGTWALVCAADLDRFLVRYPSHSPARVQRAALVRRVKILGFVGVAAFAVVGVTVLIAIEVRLPAVILIAAFVVVVLVRIVRSISRGETREDSARE